MAGLSDIEPIELGSFPIAVYAAMFGGTVAGQFLGMGIDAALIGRHLVWVPIVCSVVLEAVVGERYGSSRLHRALTFGDRGRLSAYYSVCLGALTIPLFMWTAASRKPESAFGGYDPTTTLAISVALLAGATVVRAALMPLFARRAR